MVGAAIPSPGNGNNDGDLARQRWGSILRAGRAGAEAEVNGWVLRNPSRSGSFGPNAVTTTILDLVSAVIVLVLYLYVIY